jgi:transcriptional regulator with XRE-family HTH domain
MSLGHNIRKIRESKNLSIEFVAKKINIFKSIYIKIEENSIKPTNDILEKISNLFGLSQREIINYNPNKFDSSRKNLDIKNLKDIITGSTQNNENRFLADATSLVSGNRISVVIEDLSIKDSIARKPILLSPSSLLSIGENIKIVEVKNSLPSESLLDSLFPREEEIYFPSRLLNWAEPYRHLNKDKTLFYTEINTNLKVGDIVFIVNGVHDSARRIKDSKYTFGSDGYRVIFVDGVKIALDIDYTPNLNPYKTDSIDKFINLFYVETLGDYLYVNRNITTRGGEVSFKFSKNNNNLVYFSKNFLGINKDWGETNDIQSPGFYVRGEDGTVVRYN